MTMSGEEKGFVPLGPLGDTNFMFALVLVLQAPRALRTALWMLCTPWFCVTAKTP